MAGTIGTTGAQREDDHGILRRNGRKALVILVTGADPREKEIFVWDQTTVVDSLLHWNHPTAGKTIKMQDGRVAAIRDDLIVR